MIRKHQQLESCELKFASDETTGEFEGFASTFGNKDRQNDIIVKGAFAETIKGRNTALMLKNHDPRNVIGKWVSFKETDHGLMVKGELTPGHTEAMNTYASLKHGAMSGLSIGFQIPDGGSKVEDEVRTISKIKLIEVSIVSMPANEMAQVTAVKADWIESLTTLRDFENMLRDAGFTKSAATCFVSRVRALGRSDSAKDVKDEISKLITTDDILKIIKKL